MTQGFEQTGFDVSLLEANLRLAPEARALRHQGALDLLTTLSAIGTELRGEPERTAPATVRR